MIFVAASQTPPTDPTTYVIIAGGGVFLAYMMMRLSKSKKRDPMDQPFSGAMLARQRSTERQMESLLVEFSNMSREISAQLDTRAQKLELLIQDADERIARMQALASQTPGRPSFERPGFDASPTMKIVPADAPAAPPEPVEEPPPAVDPQHAAVYRLADDGRTSQEIAAELDRPSGEIELILALRPR